MNINEFLEGLDKLFFDKKIDEAGGFLREGIASAEAEGDISSLISILNEMIGYCRETSRYAEAEKYSDKVLEIMKREGLEGTIPYATTLLNVANAMRAAGKLDKSLNLYKEVFKTYDKFLEKTDFSYASLYNNLSLLYQEMGEYEKAIDCLKKALAIAEKTEGAEFEVAVTYTNLGASELRVKKYEEATKHLEKAAEIFEQIKVADSHYAAALSAMGEALFMAGDLEAAERYYEKALVTIENYLGRTEAYDRVKESLMLVRKKSGRFGKERISGAKLCRDFYENYGAKMIHEKFPEYEERIAVGHVGEGSDCFGFDDEISEDHDFGAGFSMWLTDEDYEKIGESLRNEYDRLVLEYTGVKALKTRQAEGRNGVCKIGDFYKRLIGYEKAPSSIKEWSVIPEYALSASVNGEIYRDDLGAFTEIREKIKGYYPDKLWLLKIAQNSALYGQSAQYNYMRMAARGEWTASAVEREKAILYAMRLVYLLNRTYAPHDKWLRRGMNRLEKLKEAGKIIDELVLTDIRDINNNAEMLENIAIMLTNEMRSQNIISGDDVFMADLGEKIADKAELNELTVDELAEKIAELEFEAFDKVQNEGGRAACQNDWQTFHIMRKSQYLTWDKDMLIQYLMDFNESLKNGWNMITEKYGRMMESTAPHEYEKIKDKLPAVSEEKRQIVNEIVKIQVEWMEEFAEKYPNLASNARTIHTKDDTEWDASYETYLRGELLTYSQTLLGMYGRFIVDLSREGKNLAFLTMENTVKMYGYTDLDEAEIV